MEIQIESTDKLVTIDGIQCRLWEGTTAAGIPCKVFVHRLAVREDQDAAEFERALKEQIPPGRHVPLSAVL